MLKKSKNYSEDTIAAIATPQGTGSVSIIRISGINALGIGERITGKKLKPRFAHNCDFKTAEGNALDNGLAIFFPNPKSFTGEDVVELQCHGGIIVSEALLQTSYAYGARPADPGEFSLRAFLNDKLDLSQAEAIADLINSSSIDAARSAFRSLEGIFSQKINRLQDKLTNLRVLIEAFLDFPEDEIDIEEKERISLSEKFYSIVSDIDYLLEESKQGVILNIGLDIVIAGPPNAGKSSLMNRLAGYDTAIVTETPGTTRDILKEKIIIDGLPINIIDTAGIRTTEDPIEKEGIIRASKAISRADLLVWVCDIRSSLDENINEANRLARDKKFLVIRNKLDLANESTKDLSSRDKAVICLSVHTGEGIDLFLNELKTVSGYAPNLGGTFSARSRHLDSLSKSRKYLNQASESFIKNNAFELAAEDLRMVQKSLSEITGELTSDDLLGEIFSSFCIGK
tara:strand:- start:84617 stop:85987 length:1371 start_codon:yes stop_codon:yes gene_type:complete